MNAIADIKPHTWMDEFRVGQRVRLVGHDHTSGFVVEGPDEYRVDSKNDNKGSIELVRQDGARMTFYGNGTGTTDTRYHLTLIS